MSKNLTNPFAAQPAGSRLLIALPADAVESPSPATPTPSCDPNAPCAAGEGGPTIDAGQAEQVLLPACGMPDPAPSGAFDESPATAGGRATPLLLPRVMMPAPPAPRTVRRPAANVGAACGNGPVPRAPVLFCVAGERRFAWAVIAPGFLDRLRRVGSGLFAESRSADSRDRFTQLLAWLAETYAATGARGVVFEVPDLEGPHDPAGVLLRGRMVQAAHGFAVSRGAPWRAVEAQAWRPSIARSAVYADVRDSMRYEAASETEAVALSLAIWFFRKARAAA